MSDTNIKKAKPLGDRVLVLPIETLTETKTAGGIFIPETATTENSKFGKVISVGPGLFSSFGNLIPMNVKEGDEVILHAHNYGTEVVLDNIKYLLLRESDILMSIR